MLRISTAALGALRLCRRPIRAEWTNDDGATWTSTVVASGQVTANRTAEVRYSASCSLIAPPLGAAGINTAITQVRLWQGLTPPRNETEWIPAGRYAVTGVKQTLTGADLTLAGTEQIVRDAAFPAARTIGPDSARAILTELVTEVMPWSSVTWRPGIDPDTIVPAFTAESDRWAAISSGSDDSSGTSTGVAAALAGEVGADARGVMVAAPIPTLDGTPVWTVARGDAMVDPSPEQSADGLVNLWVVAGDGGDGSAAVGPAYAWDSDPDSITYAGPDPVGDPTAPRRLGLTGIRLRVGTYSSALLTSLAQAQAKADALLADSLGVQASLSFDAVCNPALEPADLVLAEVADGVWQRHIIDSLSYTLGAPSMSCATRTTARRLT